MEIFERGGQHAEHEVAKTLSALGRLYEGLGDLDEAESFIQRGLRIQERLFGPEHIHTANSLDRLAILRMRRDDLVGAELLLRRSLAICEKLDGPGSFRSVGPLRSLGLLYQQLGQLDQAEAFQQRSLVILQENLGPTHPRIASTLNALGRVYEAGGEYQKSQEAFERAYRLLMGQPSPSKQRVTGVMRALARLRCAQGHPESAVAWADQIQGEEERLLSNLLSFTSERQRLANQQEIVRGGSINLWATIGAAEPLARSILRTKGIVLDSLLEDRRLAEAGGDSQTREIARQLTAAKRRLTQVAHADLFEASSADKARPRKVDLESLSREVESLEASLARRVAGLGRARRALSIRVEQVQSTIPAGAVLLELLRYRHYVGKGHSEENYGALILSSDSEPRWVRLGHAEVVDRLIKLYQHQVRAQGEGDALSRSLRHLYEQLWTPIEQSLPEGTRQLIVCPDSELNFLSFATFLAPSKRFLGEDYSISYVSSGRDLLAGYPRRRDGIDLLVWANPDFGVSVVNGAASTESLRTNDSLAMREFRDLSFRPLPGSEKEGRLLRDRATEFGFNSVVLHLGKTATEAELKRVESPHILHLATHGFLLPVCSPRAMPDGFEPDDTIPGTISGVRNPMLRCGLALAGAQRTLEARAKGEIVPSENDGVVTAEEIGCLNLRGTRLVVLSACDTGIGEARAGEGVLGLRRGFVQAGAESLLLTLWPIHDDKTTGLIADFYAAVGKHGDATRALSQTQRSWLTRLRTEKGVADACRIAGPFILSFQGSPDSE